MEINWDRYFDHTVIVSAAKYQNRRDILDKEFKRIGLSNYEYFINIYDNLLTDKFIARSINRRCCIHAHYFVIKRAYELGWDSVWILEDDIRFLKNESDIQFVLDEFEQVKDQSNIYMFDWILFQKHSDIDKDYFGAASYWIDRKGMEFFIYVIEHYLVINDTWFMTCLAYVNSISIPYNYEHMNGDVDELVFTIPENTVLPIVLKTSSLRICIQVDEGDVVSIYYKPQCEENTIDGNMYELY